MNLLEATKLIRDVPDFPKPGILFKDITPLLGNHAAFTFILDSIHKQFNDIGYDYVLGIEARGFIFAAALAAQTGAGFIPARKPGKLPAAVDRVDYTLEYSSGSLEIHKESLSPGKKVLIVDDVIATGGTALAGGNLVKMQGGIVVGYGFAVEIEALKGRGKLPTDAKIYSVLTY